jgi:CO/xanthine dehydrogenase Mo-binding subunit
MIALQIPDTPVRLEWTRAEEMTISPFGAASTVRLAARVDAAGTPLDWTIEIWSPSHVNRPGANGAINLLAAEDLPGLPPPPPPADLPDAAGAGGVRNAFALYDLPPQRLLHHFVPHTPLHTSSMRGLGAQANVFAIESFIDELALAAAADPVGYRLSLMSDPRARAVIAEAARMCGWDTRAPGGEGNGTGFAFSRYKNRAGYLAVAVHVSVDESVRVNRVWAACDAGLVINPDGARNQIEGGIVQAISWTLKEEVRVDADGIATGTWESYPILRFSEVPEIEISLIGSAHDPSLGLGEVALGPTCAAIANAVAHALGTRLRDLPLNRDKIMAALLA